MSTILLEEAKRFLQITHDSDDLDLQRALDAAEEEACGFMDRDFLPVSERELPSECASDVDPVSEGESPSDASEEIAPAVKQAVFVLMKANYDGIKAGDSMRGLLDLDAYRKRAETLMMPFRRHLGV